MKKIMIILFLMPITVFGVTCDMKKDTQTGENRVLVCDDEKKTITTYKTNREIKVLDNSVCTITCAEEIVFSIDPVKKVLAGTSFNYPLYVSGERKCKASYDYENYEYKIQMYVNEYGWKTGVDKANVRLAAQNLYNQKKECDEFAKEGSEYQNKYQYNGDVTLKLETSTNEIEVPYSFKDISEYSSNVILNKKTYSSCNFNENDMKCRGSNETISDWTETARIYGKYTMNDVYLEKYTGEIKNVYNSNTCNAGDRYFTNFTEVTRPVKNDTTDKGYKLTLTAEKLGDNLDSSYEWSLNVDCWYQVKNLMFPQNVSGGVTDENYEKYGGTAFEYRLIDLDNPFPGRVPGANWDGNENIITSTKDSLSTLQKFVISLNRSSINKVREYNDVHSYDTFNLNDMEKSTFIESNTSIINRR